MTISSGWRLLLYNAMAALPIFIDFAKNSQDFTPRGLVNPTLNALYAMVLITLAKTAPTNGDEPQKVDVVNKPGAPIPVKEVLATTPTKP